MRIFHLSDIHGDLKSLESVVAFVNKESDGSDFVAVTGDFAGILGTPITPYFWNDIHKKKGRRLTLERLKEAEISAITQHYEDLKGIVNGIKIPVFSVPGNCDWINYENELIGGNHQTVHKKTVEHNGVNITGFGGSEGILPYLAWHPHYSVYETVLQNPKFPTDGYLGVSNLYDFLANLSESPDIIITHMPPAKFQPIACPPPEKDVGSYGLMDYLNKRQNILTLCGHQHESKGLQHRGNGVIIINAGNLVITGHDNLDQGNFFVIEYSDGFRKAECFLLNLRREISQAESYTLSESSLQIQQK